MTEQHNTPKLRFPEFTESWQHLTLGDIGKVAMNKRIYKNQTSEQGEIPFYKISTFGKKPTSFISREIFEEYKQKFPYPNKGDVLISASGSIGKTIEFDGEEAYFQDSNIIWLDHQNKISNKFLKQFYDTVKWDKIEGSTIKRLYNKNFLNTSIFLPTRQEQDKIGDLFEKIDKHILLQEKQIHLLKYKLNFYIKNLYSQNIVFKNKDKPYSNWKKTNIDNITNYLSSKRDARNSIENNVVSGYPIYDATKEIAQSNVYDIETQYISIIKDGSGVGRLNLREGKSSVISTMGYIIPDNINIYFLFYFLKTINFNKYIIVCTIPHLYYKDLSKEILTVLLDENELNKKGEFLFSLDKVLLKKRYKLEKLKLRKTSLLKKMLI